MLVILVVWNNVFGLKQNGVKVGKGTQLKSVISTR